MSDGVAAGLRQLLAGEPTDRRGALRAGVGAAALGLPALLAACGQTIHPPANTTSYVIDVAGTSPPASDLVRLITARAKALEMAPTLTATGAVGLVSAVRLQARLGIFDPQANRTPAITDLIAAAAVAPTVLEPILATARRRGVKVLTYPLPLRSRTAAIIVDAAAGATALARHAAAWAHTHGAADATALLVLAPRGAGAINPYAADPSRTERALRAALAGAAPGLSIATTTAFRADGGRLAVAQALAGAPGIRIVLVWDDDTAIGAAQAVAASGPHRGYVGGLGAPCVTSRATFAELQRDGPLQIVIAAAPRDLANALVDLPHAMLRGRRVGDVTLPLRTLTPRSRTLQRYQSQYARHPPETNYDNAQINPTAVIPTS